MAELTFREVGPDEVAQIKAQFKRFIDEEVIPAEPELNRQDDAAAKKLEELKQRAKRAGLWALGHPEEIGGRGLPFLAFAEMNEVIGRSHYGQLAVGSVSMQDSRQDSRLLRQANNDTSARWTNAVFLFDSDCRIDGIAAISFYRVQMIKWNLDWYPNPRDSTSLQNLIQGA